MGASDGSSVWRSGLAVLLVTAFAGGCGGDDGPSAAERRAELKRWVQKANGVCRETEQQIAGRGQPVDLLDLDRVAVRAAQDVRRALARIERLKFSPAVRPRVQPLVAELGRLDEIATRLTRATESGDADAMPGIARDFERWARSMRHKGPAVGLWQCSREIAEFWASDAIIAPVFANEVAAFERQLMRSIGRLGREVPQTGMTVLYRRLAAAFKRARQQWSELIPPERARDASDAYDRALADLERFAASVTADMREGGPASARRIRRRFARLSRAERKASKGLWHMIGARPLPVAPPGEPPTDGEETSA